MTAAREWHVGDWGPLGWLETAIKAAAFALAYLAFARAIGGDVGTPDGRRLAELAVLVVAEAGLLAAIGDRLLERELIAMAFVVAANLAHLGMLFALCSTPGPGHLVIGFCALMLLGEAVKLGFLRSTGFTVRDVRPGIVQSLTLGYAAIYLVGLLVWQLA